MKYGTKINNPNIDSKIILEYLIEKEKLDLKYYYLF